MVGYGSRIPKGKLPVYSVGTEQEAKRLITLTCPMSDKGEHIAPELAREQTLDNLQAFSDRLHKGHELLKQRGNCTCT